MRYSIQSACGCNKGKIRQNNEDNFYFDNHFLEIENNGLEQPLNKSFSGNGTFYAIFDGMGGENYGEYAAYTAASAMLVLSEMLLPEGLFDQTHDFEALVNKLDESVVRMQQEMFTDKMGSTMVGLYFGRNSVFSINVGDSRSYLIRDDVIMQISKDHVEHRPGSGKNPLTQYLGYGTEDIILDPYIKQVVLERGDKFLICSDGLSDMVPEKEVLNIIDTVQNAKEAVSRLIDAAMINGGRDNITVIFSIIE